MDNLDQFLAPYFKKACHAALDGLMNKAGFDVVQEQETTVFYINTKKNTILEISYLPETLPQYSLLMGIGFLEKEKSLVRRSIGVWDVLPSNALELGDKSCCFDSEANLTQLLKSFCTQVLEKHMIPLMHRPSELKQLIEQSESEIEKTEQKEIYTQQQIRAEEAFGKKDFNLAVRLYQEIPENFLSSIDIKRIEYAKKHTSSL